MTIQELGQTVLELLAAVWRGIGQIFACAGELLSSDTSAKSAGAVQTNAIKLFSNIILNRLIFFAVLAYIIFINVLTYHNFKVDKKRATRKEYRISESRLFVLMFLGGSLGAIIGMNAHRHKTLKKKFTVTAVVLFAAQLMLYCFILGFLAFWAFF